MKKKISISVVLYNTPLEDIDNVINSIDFEIADLYFIDNSSSPRLKNYLSKFNNLCYIDPTINLGFGAGHNYILKHFEIQSKYHLILNPDVSFDQSLLLRMCCIMDEHPEIGILTPKVIYPNFQHQESCRYLPSPLTLVLRRLKLSFLLKNFDKLVQQFNKPLIDVPFPLGCFLLFRTEVYRKINGFDERYFMYMEDVDIARKTLELGYRVVYSSENQIIHSYGKGSRINIKLLRFHVASMMKYFNKWGWFFDAKRIIANNDAIRFLSMKG